MTLYHIFRRDPVGLDEARGFIVRASSPEVARELASTQCGDEGKHRWLDATATACEVVTPKGEEGVLLRSFRDG